jgi:hypothetical protein
MSKMNHTDEGYGTSITLEKPTGTLVTLDTSSKYLDGPVELTLNAKSDTVSVNGGNINAYPGFLLSRTISVSNTNTSGISIMPRSVVTRDSVYINMDVDGWVNLKSGTELIIPDGKTVEGSISYVTGVTLTNGKQFDVTVPNGSNSTITFHFSVDNNGNTTITGGD